MRLGEITPRGTVGRGSKVLTPPQILMKNKKKINEGFSCGKIFQSQAPQAVFFLKMIETRDFLYRNNHYECNFEHIEIMKTDTNY